jgi:hypothetical protein
MTQETLQELSPSSSNSRPNRRWVELLLSSGVLVALVQVLPLCIAAWRENVPLSRVPIGWEQKDYFKENLTCLLEQHSTPAANTPAMKVSLLVCPSGDTLVTLINKATESETSRWVSPETFAHNSVALDSLFIPSAVAIVPTGSQVSPNLTAPIAQAPTVLCQELRDGKLIRNLKYEDGRCEQEVTNTFTGEVTRTSITCSASC